MLALLAGPLLGFQLANSFIQEASRVQFTTYLTGEGSRVASRSLLPEV